VRVDATPRRRRKRHRLMLDQLYRSEGTGRRPSQFQDVRPELPCPATQPAASWLPDRDVNPVPVSWGRVYKFQIVCSLLTHSWCRHAQLPAAVRARIDTEHEHIPSTLAAIHTSIQNFHARGVPAISQCRRLVQRLVRKVTPPTLREPFAWGHANGLTGPGAAGES
jgi:hypothetical protein